MEDDFEVFRNVWLALRSRYRWSLIEGDKEHDFLRAVAESFGQRPPAPANPLHVKAELQRHYYRSQYDAVVMGRLNPRDPEIVAAADRACGEIYAMVWRLVRKRGYAEDIAEEIGQKVVERLIARPDKVTTPEALPVWAIWQIRDFLGKMNVEPTESLDQTRDGEEERTLTATLASTQDVGQDVEEMILVEQVLNLLPSILSEFQRQVIHLVVLNDYKPRDAAIELNTSSHHIRVEKSRALAIIRNHPRIKKWLDSE